MNSPIPTLRPNYTHADFKPGQTVFLRADGTTGVSRALHGRRATVLAGTSSKRRILVRLLATGAGEAVPARNSDLRVTPSQIALILE